MRRLPVRIAAPGNVAGHVKNVLGGEGKAGQRPITRAGQVSVAIGAESVERVRHDYSIASLRVAP